MRLASLTTSSPRPSGSLSLLRRCHASDSCTELAGLTDYWSTSAAHARLILGSAPALADSFRTLAPLANPRERASMLAAVYLVSYIAFSVPAVIACKPSRTSDYAMARPSTPVS